MNGDGDEEGGGGKEGGDGEPLFFSDFWGRWEEWGEGFGWGVWG